MAGLDLPYGTGYMLAGPLLTLGPPSLPLFFLGGGYGWCGLQSSTLVLPSGGGSKQKYGEPQAHTPPWSLNNTQFQVLSGWCPSWDPWCSFYGSGLRVLSLSASPALVGSPCPPT